MKKKLYNSPKLRKFVIKVEKDFKKNPDKYPSFKLSDWKALDTEPKPPMKKEKKLVRCVCGETGMEESMIAYHMHGKPEQGAIGFSYISSPKSVKKNKGCGYVDCKDCGFTHKEDADCSLLNVSDCPNCPPKVESKECECWCHQNSSRVHSCNHCFTTQPNEECICEISRCTHADCPKHGLPKGAYTSPVRISKLEKLRVNEYPLETTIPRYLVDIRDLQLKVNQIINSQQEK